MGIGDTITLADLLRDPYPIYRHLRAEAPVCHIPAIGRWLVTRWDDIEYVDHHPELFTASEEGSLMTRAMGLSMLRTDGAAHARLRARAEAPLRPGVVRRNWLDRFATVANDLIDRFAGRGEVELMAEYAGPFAAHTLKLILGLDEADNGDMQFWSQAFIDGIGNYADDPAVWERAARASREVDSALEAAIPRRRAAPDASVLSSFLNGSGPGEPITLDEVRANIKLFISGGLNEPRDAIAIATWALLTHPEQLALAREDPALFTAATEETLRWISPVGMFPRRVTRDTDLAGVQLRAGDRLGAAIASANRDERHWSDPDRFDITADRRKHLAFSTGAHFCVGAWVTRQQIGATALPILFARLPGLRLDPELPMALHGWAFRGPRELHLRWDVAT